MKKINIIICVFFSIFVIYSILNIKETNLSTMNVLLTFTKNIFPSLFIFLILNQLIIKLGIIDFLAYLMQFISYPIFKISGKGASIIIIGLLNGFPSSAIFTSLMVKNNELDKIEAQRLVNALFFPSISFLFATINILLNDKTLFLYLILSLYLSGFIFIYISSFKIKQETSYITLKETKLAIKEKINNFSFIKNLKEIISYSFNTLVDILGIIVIFSIPCNIINSILKNKLSLFFQGLIEFSIPSIKLLSTNINKKLLIVPLATILSFTGLSSIMQASIFISEANLNTKQFVINRILITMLTTTILYLFAFLL